MVGEQIKLIIFDLDGTLYDLGDVISTNYRMQVEFYSEQMRVPVGKAESVFAQNNILPIISPEARSATEFFSSSGMDMFAWQDYRNSHFDVGCIDVSKAVGADALREYHSQYQLCLLTSNSYVNTNRILKKLGISINEFDKIVCSDHNYEIGVFHKIDAIRSIIKHFNVLPRECLSIGDRFSTDVIPALRLGAFGIVVDHPWAVKEAYKFLSSDKGLNVSQTGFTLYQPDSD